MFAHQLGVVIVPVVPCATIAAGVAATLVLADLISLVPARRVAVMNTADALRVP